MPTLPEKKTNATAVLASLQDRKRQLVKEAIWDAATDLFAEKGYDDTTVEEIVQAGGVSQRSFFRYFSSKSDLMAHSMEVYGGALVKAIDSCPPTYSDFEVFRHTAFQVAQATAAQPRTRKTMEIISKYPAARAAEVSRFPEVQDRVFEAFARRRVGKFKDGLMPKLIAGLTMHVLGMTLLSWFAHPQQDVTVTAEHAIDALDRLVCGKKNKK